MQMIHTRACRRACRNTHRSEKLKNPPAGADGVHDLMGGECSHHCHPGQLETNSHAVRGASFSYITL